MQDKVMAIFFLLSFFAFNYCLGTQRSVDQLVKQVSNAPRATYDALTRTKDVQSIAKKLQQETALLVEQELLLRKELKDLIKVKEEVMRQNQGLLNMLVRRQLKNQQKSLSIFEKIQARAMHQKKEDKKIWGLREIQHLVNEQKKDVKSFASMIMMQEDEQG